MPFRLWLYLAKVGGFILFAFVFATSSASADSALGRLRLGAMCILIPLCFIGAFMAILMAFGKLKMLCPFCGRSGRIRGGRRRGIWLECESCGIVRGSGLLGLKIVRGDIADDHDLAPQIKLLQGVCVGLCVLGIVNFMVFWVVSVCLGGDALNGGSADGHYFLDRNHRTEVSSGVWHYSLIHAKSQKVTILLAIVSSGALSLYIPKSRPRGSPSKMEERPMPPLDRRAWWFALPALISIAAFAVTMTSDLSALWPVFGILATAVAFLLFLLIRERRCPQCGCWLQSRRYYPDRNSPYYCTLRECDRCQIAWNCGGGYSRL